MTTPVSCGYVKVVTIKLGLQIPNFSYGTGVAELFPTVIAQAQEAEAAGFDSVFVMDHFYQLPGIGTPDQPMLEAYTALGALATATERVQLGTLVTGNTYRNPTLLAKAITTLDVVSAGPRGPRHRHRLVRARARSARLRVRHVHRPLQQARRSAADHPADARGRAADVLEASTTRRVEAMANPRFRDHIPLMIGGSGEKKTIPLAAKHFDHLNIIAGFDELPRKVDVVKQRCEEIGRDPATLETSMLVIAMIDENVTADFIPDNVKQQAVFGSPEQIAEQVKTKVLDAGVDGVILSPVTNINGYHPGRHHGGRRSC